jgi:hypothetical protein
MAFDAHAADFGLVLADYFQSALDQKHPSLRHFKLGPVYFLDDQDFGAARKVARPFI